MQTPTVPHPDGTSRAPRTRSLLRLATAGSVDDGKSTLVGRLLHDTRQVFADQLEAVERVSREKGLADTDLALLTDGLRAEREQGITIDVAYRYFATARRRFILADTPGHVQYTRNMVTGASTAQVAVVLVDARHGVVEQTRRHLAVAALLRVPHVVLAVNKMDLVDYEEATFAAITDTVAEYTRALGAPAVTAVPVSALRGDNVVLPSARMDWHTGPTLLEHLETVTVAADRPHAPARLPVQYVLRPQRAEFRDYRGYAGQVTSGTFRPGEEVVVLPSGKRTTIVGIDRLGERDVPDARAEESVTIRLTDDLDIARGDLLAAVARAPRVTREVTATVCHLADRPLRVGDRVLLRHGTAAVRARVDSVDSVLDLETLHGEPGATSLRANEIGRITLRAASPLPLDDYADHRRTGSFLLVDETDGTTLTAGMVGPGD